MDQFADSLANQFAVPEFLVKREFVPRNAHPKKFAENSDIAKEDATKRLFAVREPVEANALPTKSVENTEDAESSATES